MSTITGIRRLDDTIRRTVCNGDNWHMTWAADDRQYTSLCDGAGWPGMPGYGGPGYNTRVYAVAGDPTEPTFEFLPGYPDLPVAENRYYGFGIIALGDHIYEFLSTPNHRFSEPDAGFAGAKLIYSPDLGRTWRNRDGSPVRWEPWEERSRGNMAFLDEPGECFSLLSILQMGRDYQHNHDGYVYVYAPNGNTEGAMNQLVMFRVARDSLLDRSQYEYFVSRNADGTAVWSHDIGRRGVVHTFPSGWVNTTVHPYSWHPSVVYIAPLDVYMMANWGMGCDEKGMWFGKPSYLGFWTAKRPWGPWTQIHEELAWTPGGDAAARAYQPQIAPKWIAEDGLSFWLVWTDFQVIDGQRPYYSFNYQQVEVIS